MDDDWASDSGDDLGDLSALPEVKLPDPPVKPVPPPSPVPTTNAWTSPNQSGDVRAAMRPRMSNPSPARPVGRRENLFSSPNTPAEHRASRPNGSSRGITLYVSNLPFETNEREIAAFFSNAGVDPADIRLSRHSDTGNIKAAFVTLRPEASTQLALSLDGRQLGSRSLHIKIEGSDRDRRSVNRDYSYGRERERDRSGHQPVSYGGSFGGRERRSEDSPSAWGAGGWVDRSSAAPSNNFENDRRDRASPDIRDPKAPMSARTDAHQPLDPTIPTGPPAPGRKKLQLKPRTKPPPVLEVDRRTIDAPNPQKTPPLAATTVSTSERPIFRASSAPKKEVDASGEEWTNAKESGMTRTPMSNQSASKKEDDSKRPVLLNAFAALGVDEADM